MTEDELQDLVNRFVNNKVDVESLPLGTVAELAHGLARMFRARVWNCIDPRGKKDPEWNALAYLLDFVSNKFAQYE